MALMHNLSQGESLGVFVWLRLPKTYASFKAVNSYFSKPPYLIVDNVEID